MSTIKVTTIQNLAGVEVYTAKAWVNFNGTGTVAIRASGNVSSITDNGTGNYTINFTSALADANYMMAGSITRSGFPGYLPAGKEIPPGTLFIRTGNFEHSLKGKPAGSRFQKIITVIFLVSKTEAQTGII